MTDEPVTPPAPEKRAVVPLDVFAEIMNLLTRQPYQTVAQLIREIEQKTKFE